MRQFFTDHKNMCVDCPSVGVEVLYDEGSDEVTFIVPPFENDVNDRCCVVYKKIKDIKCKHVREWAQGRQE